MSTLSSSSRWLACLCLVAFLALGAASAHAGTSSPGAHQALNQLLPPDQDPGAGSGGGEPDVNSPVQDSDGDGIPNIQDPDDDNAGVSDRDDPEPFNPGVEPTPPSDPLSPIHDDDGDGIPNIQDPDDDNDGISDDEDPGDPDPVAGGGGGEGGGAGSGSGSPAGQTTQVGGGAPLVTALPSTGGSPEAGMGLVNLALITAGITLLAATGVRLRTRIAS
jgi:hypothetical protein